MHDRTAVLTKGIAEQFRGLQPCGPRSTPATWPPKKPKDEACDGDKYAWRETRQRRSSARICVEHTNAELRRRAPLRRFVARRVISRTPWRVGR
jgi:hypothetical protein